ncbi:MAG: hypothetical protein CFE44_09990 [Burkholderiales bacterium PBB4]|nr:MAG: hypothetical protein CFE44_09990 [Burkholderiales bacterium PBB4]
MAWTTPQFTKLVLGVATALALVHPAASIAGPVQPFLDQLVKKEKLPGAILLVSGPRGRQIATAGVANLKTREPITEDSRFYIASSGKLVTAVATHQLVAENKLKLKEPVFKWVKDIKGIQELRNIRAVTVEQLLKHRSGIAEYFTDDIGDAAEENPEKRYSIQESLAFVYGEAAEFKPGAEYSYNNTNYVLLGALIETADKTSYAKAIQRRIFDPVGMQASTIGARPAESRLAHGYEYDRNRPKDVSYTGWNAITGDGAVVTTASDYEAFLNALFKDETLLPEATVERMCQPQAEEPDSGYGMGCSILDTPWGPAWGHDGSITGFNAETWYIKSIDTTVVFFTNGDFQSDDPDVVVRAVKAYLKN